ncbi:Putative Lipoate-protein ligase A [Podospora comata]|uniref:Putative lipoate-protein ligase A n=1 Tax=Podospora comata TaxID=48703 RepID=A0ABY6S8Z2_PODCO|nr:Putative Lipoate-protein ligase A [Podospora comata]
MATPALRNAWRIRSILSTRQARPITTKAISQKFQIYTSSSANPYLNLSIEHHLLEKSDPDSTILFLYTNDPCVVIGRNQNPWTEVNLPQLSQTRIKFGQLKHHLVRRRSGGGTVVHDHGNANWSVICPKDVFDRDKHALMVVEALKNMGIKGVKVNERHDIVQEAQDAEGPEPAPSTYKISGSAYKLTGKRALHHGTLLLNSDLSDISGLLRSPAAPYIAAQGVESVRSPVCNVGVEDNADFYKAVIDQFMTMYPDSQSAEVKEVDQQEALNHDNIWKGVQELLSPKWLWESTPKFRLASHPTPEDPRPRPHPPSDFFLTLTARHSEILDLQTDSPLFRSEDHTASLNFLLKQKIHEVPKYCDLREWKHYINFRIENGRSLTLRNESVGSICKWLLGNDMLATGPIRGINKSLKTKLKELKHCRDGSRPLVLDHAAFMLGKPEYGWYVVDKQ